MNDRDDIEYDEPRRNFDPSAKPEELPILIPIGSLSPQALAGVVQSFVLREGTRCK